MLVRSSAKRRRKEKDELMKKYSSAPGDEEKNNYIDKIARGEKVKIPYAAFDYIYRHIDDFGVIDKDGQIILVNQEAYEKIINADITKLPPTQNSEISKSIEHQNTYVQLIHNDDGSVVEKNINENNVKITKANGDILLADGNKMTTIKQNEENNTNSKALIAKNKQNKVPTSNDIPNNDVVYSDGNKNASSTIYEDESNENEETTEETKKIPPKKPKESLKKKVKEKSKEMNDVLKNELLNQFTESELSNVESVEISTQKPLEISNENIENIITKNTPISDEELPLENSKNSTPIHFKYFYPVAFTNIENYVDNFNQKELQNFIHIIIKNSNNLDYKFMFKNE